MVDPVKKILGDQIPWGKKILIKELDNETVLDAVMYGLAKVEGDKVVYFTESQYSNRRK